MGYKSKVWILTIMLMTEMDEDLCRPIFCAGFYRVGQEIARKCF